MLSCTAFPCTTRGPGKSLSSKKGCDIADGGRRQIGSHFMANLVPSPQGIQKSYQEHLLPSDMSCLPLPDSHGTITVAADGMTQESGNCSLILTRPGTWKKFRNRRLSTRNQWQVFPPSSLFFLHLADRSPHRKGFVLLGSGRTFDCWWGLNDLWWKSLRYFERV